VDSTFEGNTAGGNSGAGAIDASKGALVSIVRSMFKDNFGQNTAGAIRMSGGNECDVDTNPATPGSWVKTFEAGTERWVCPCMNHPFVKDSSKYIPARVCNLRQQQMWSTLIVVDSTITRNMAYSGRGGAIYLNGKAHGMINNSLIDANMAWTSDGGGIAVRQATLEMHNTTMRRNMANLRNNVGMGGAIHIGQGGYGHTVWVRMSSSTIEHNFAAAGSTVGTSSDGGGRGGGIYQEKPSSELVLADGANIFRENWAVRFFCFCFCFPQNKRVAFFNTQQPNIFFHFFIFSSGKRAEHIQQRLSTTHDHCLCAWNPHTGSITICVW
jgi:hypothetical protein